MIGLDGWNAMDGVIRLDGLMECDGRVIGGLSRRDYLFVEMRPRVEKASCRDAPFSS
ncbi:MAG: hypothetical protein H6544_08105 [Prevotellaceae bacterium]|nr:hypothetical protein [Prevotellaceae bacterium]